VQDVYYDPGANFGQAPRSTFDGTFDITFLGDGLTGSTRLKNGEDFWIEFEKESISESGCLIHRGCWPVEPGSVAVRYIAGYSPAELQGQVDEDAAEADRELDYITCPGVDASPIAEAVMMTVAKGLHGHQALKKSDAGKGFDGGNTYQSERLQDYSYTRPQNQTGAGTVQLTGNVVALPTDALEMLDPFKHYGILRL
jgi:hypothetical protein